MFDLETILRVVAVVVGLLILSTSFVDYSGVFSKLLLNKKKDNTVPNSSNDDKFLEIVDLWYKLRSKCVDYKLDLAVEKIDEVFPLLNDNIEVVKNV